jgi:hypothetical protein
MNGYEQFTKLVEPFASECLDPRDQPLVGSRN